MRPTAPGSGSEVRYETPTTTSERALWHQLVRVGRQACASSVEPRHLTLMPVGQPARYVELGLTNGAGEVTPTR